MKLLLLLFCLIEYQLAYSQGVVTSQLKPIVTVTPKYPAQAVLKRIEGFVDIEFTVDVNGSVKNARVVQAEPENIFNQAAKQAILKYKFLPQRVDKIAVEQVATQRIQFKLSAEIPKKPTLLELFATKTPTEAPFFAVYDLKIDKERNTTKFADVLVVDTKDGINEELLVWQDTKQKIPNFQTIQSKVIKQAKSDFLKSHGAFNQYQKLCLEKTCPPILLSQLNSLPFKGVVDFIKLKVEMTIDSLGNVKNYKVKKAPRKYKNNPALIKMISQLKFLPATNNNKSITTKTTVNIRAFVASQKIVFFLWVKQHSYLLMKPPNQWVRVAFLINKRGNVIQIEAIDSSDKIYENEAINAVKKYQFKKSKRIQQAIQLISFSLAK